MNKAGHDAGLSAIMDFALQRDADLLMDRPMVVSSLLEHSYFIAE